MNGFVLHGIEHSSPSSLNMYAAAPCAWIAKYLLGRKFNFSHAARAGVLAEAAIVNVLSNGHTVEDETAKALAEYNKACALGASDNDRKRADAIPGMIALGIEELQQYGEPEFEPSLFGKNQKKIELLCRTDDWQLPVIGYLDLHYPKHGLVIDIKTTLRLPSEMSNEHLRQGAIYRAATGNSTVKFLYLSGKGHRWHEVEDHAPVLKEVKGILTRQERFLRLGDDALLRDVVPVQQGSFYWTGDETMRQEIYGI